MLYTKNAFKKVILGSIFTILFFSLLTVVGCKKKSPVSPKNHKPNINNVNAQPSHLAYGDTTLLTVNATDQDNDNLTYQWRCNSGSFVGTTTSDSANWIAPNQVGTYRCDVTVYDGLDSTASGVDIQVMGLFFDEFSTDLSAWTKMYCDAWISSEEAHLEGNTSGYYGTLYHYFTSYVAPQYTVNMKLARVDYFSSGDYYGLYTKVNDTGSINIAYWWFVIYPSFSGKNWSIICFLSFPYSNEWCLFAENSFGDSPLIKTDILEWNDISWTVEDDKTIIVKVGNELLYQSDEISIIEDLFDLTITMDLVRAGCRTKYHKEVKIDDAVVSTPPGVAISASSGKILEKESDHSSDNVMNIPLSPQDRSKLPTLRKVLKNTR